MIGVNVNLKGDYTRTENALKKLRSLDIQSVLEKYGEKGVQALRENTPKDTGLTADSWSYRIERRNSGLQIIWTNSHVVRGVNIALILQYGHGTRQGGYVKGIDYINPALQPVFDEIADNLWAEVSKI